MVVLKRLGRAAEAKQVEKNQDAKKLLETKTLGTQKTSWLSQSSKGRSKKKDRFSSEDPQFFANQTCDNYAATKKSWTKEESGMFKGKENLLPFSSPSGLSTRLRSSVAEKQSGVHFASQNKVFAASQHSSGVKEPKTHPLKDKSLWSSIQPGFWLQKLREGDLKQQLCGILKATILVFLHEWGGSTVLLQHSILILIQGGTPEADVFNLNLILGGAVLATSTAGGLLSSRGSPSCRRALFLATAAVTVASLALLSLSLALRCPGQHLLDFSTTNTSNVEEDLSEQGRCDSNRYLCGNECQIIPCGTTTTTPSPQNSTIPIEPLICKNSNFPNELLLLAAIMASQNLGLNVCTKLNVQHAII